MSHFTDFVESCTAAARSVLCQLEEQPLRNDRVRWIAREAAALAGAPPQRLAKYTGPRVEGDELAWLVAQRWHDLTTGFTGNDLMHDHPGLWHKLMHGWPMGCWPTAMRRTLVELGYERQDIDVLELGAGTGNLTAQWRCAPRRYVATDADPVLVQRLSRWHVVTETHRLDIDRDSWWPEAEFDLIVACNVLHCSADPAAALRRCLRALRPGGLLMFGEGSPVVLHDGHLQRWPLTFAYGAFDGWWNRGGFRIDWIEQLDAAGELVDVRWRPVPLDDDVTAGKVWTAIKGAS